MDEDKQYYLSEQISQKLQYWVSTTLLLGILLFPFIGVADYFYSYELFGRFLNVRIGITALLIVGYFLNRLKRNITYQYVIIIATTICSAVAIEIMVLSHGGHASSYYAGIVLLIIAAIGLIPFSLSLSILTGMAIYAIYVVPIVLLDEIMNRSVFIANNIFLLATFAITLTWRMLSHRAMINELNLQYDLSRERNKLEQLVQERTKELHRSEKWHRSLFESATDGIVVLDKNGTIVNVNDRACALYGQTRETLVGAYGSILEQANARAAIADRLTRVLSGETLVYEVEHARRDGSRLFLEVNAKSVTIGDAVYVQSFHRDITDRKKMEDEVLTIKMQRMESLGVLAGGIAHDFNNILTAILTNVYLAKMDMASDSDAHKRMLEAEKASERARHLTQQLLTFSRGGAPVKKTLSLKSIIKDSALFALGGSNVACDFLLADDLLPVEADEGQMEQVIHNLIINADHAMPDGGVIRVGAENVFAGPEQGVPAGKGEYIRITVEDRGVGIQPEHLSQIYDPYFTTKAKGKGLGLSVVFSIIKNHGGHIQVHSTPGAGSTFQIYLPASDKEPLVKSGEAETPAVYSGHILIMDDEEPIRTAVSEILGRLGYAVAVSRDGAEALEKYKTAMDSGKPFDVVIIDLTVPGGMGGRELIRNLREIDPKVRGIVSSGYSTDPIMADFKAHGFCGVVTKPYSIQALSKAVRDVVAEKSL